MYWNDKPYHSLDYYLKENFGQKVYKLALDGQMTCPNRDGTLGHSGCIFCSEGGSGDFAAKSAQGRISVSQQIEDAKQLIQGKMKNGKYIAYFQSYTNTYAPVSYLKSLFTEAVSHPDIAALSIATRPDCLPEDVLCLLTELNLQKPVWVELGLQTIHPSTASFIRRGYPLSCFDIAYSNLKARGLAVIVHVILGLPSETEEMLLQTIDYLGKLHVDGIKLQLLHVLEGTDLAASYRHGEFNTLSMNEYIDLLINCIEHLPPDTVIHRISGDGPKKLLIAPLWSGNKRLVLNTIHQEMKRRNTYQGRLWKEKIIQ